MALEQIQNLQLAEDAEKTVVVNTDSKVTLETLEKRNKHYTLIGNVRKEIKGLEDQQWAVLCNWIRHTSEYKEMKWQTVWPRRRQRMT